MTTRTVAEERSGWQVIEGDSAEVLQGMDDCSVDMVACDPPYGISFMNRDWDAALPDPSIWRECLRVLKPGAAACVMSGPRLDCLWRVCRDLEEAGFELQQTALIHIFRSGFPKGCSFSAMADRRAGVEREAVGTKRSGYGKRNGVKDSEGGIFQNSLPEDMKHIDITSPATPLASALSGQYSKGKIKPAFELIIFARKPIESGTIPTPELAALLDAHDWPSDYLHNRKETVGTDEKSRARIIKLCKQHGVRPYLKGKQAALTTDNQTSLREGLECRTVLTHAGGETVVATSKYKARLPRSEWTNVVEWGTGAVNCGACMVPFDWSDNSDNWQRAYTPGSSKAGPTNDTIYGFGGSDIAAKERANAQGGRFPANVLCTGDKPLGDGTRFFDVELWAEQHGLAEEGWAEAAEAGMLQVPKAARREKNQGCDGLPASAVRPSGNAFAECTIFNGENGDDAWRAKNPSNPATNNHPTTKPVRLFAYLISLLCPEGGTVLDCFAGSGSTLVAAIQTGRNAIGIEMEPDYCKIAEARCRWAEENMPEAQEPEQLTLEAAP